MRRRDFIAALGSATAWPLVVRAQHPPIPVIGLLNSLSSDWPFAVAFRQGLKEMGYVEAKT
jgi:hypothetical protein